MNACRYLCQNEGPHISPLTRDGSGGSSGGSIIWVRLIEACFALFHWPFLMVGDGRNRVGVKFQVEFLGMIMLS